MPPRRAQSRSGSTHFREGEVDRLLNIVNELLPRDDNEWQLVTDQYNLNRPREFPEREKDSIRNVKKPTGDQTIPASVRRAKQIQRRIEDRISVETADDGVNHNEIEDDLDDDVSINYEGLDNDESNNNVEDAEATLEEDNGLGESSGNIAGNGPIEPEDPPTIIQQSSTPRQQHPVARSPLTLNQTRSSNGQPLPHRPPRQANTTTQRSGYTEQQLIDMMQMQNSSSTSSSAIRSARSPSPLRLHPTH